jgi:hypothetical protein
MVESGRSATVESAVAINPVDLRLRLLGDLQCVVDLDPEVSDRTLKFGMAEEKLDGPEILGPL